MDLLPRYKPAKTQKGEQKEVLGSGYVTSKKERYPYEPYIQYFGRLEASQNNIVHFDMKKSISVNGILVEYVGSSCSENVISIKMRVPLIHYSEM